MKKRLRNARGSEWVFAPRLVRTSVAVPVRYRVRF
jgi:hypothetical protein